MIMNPRKAYDEGWIKGVENPGKQIQQNGIDVRIESIHEIITDGALLIGKKELPDMVECMPEDWQKKDIIIVRKGTPYLVISKEYVEIPENVAAIVIMRSTLNRIGAPIHSGLYDSGFRGKIQPTLYPFRNARLEIGARYAQIIFMQANSARLYAGDFQDQGLTPKKYIEGGLKK